jgi:hypothetical protein
MATTFKTAGPYMPTRSVAGAGGYSQMAGCDPFSQNFVFDRVIKDMPLSVLNFDGTTSTITTMASGARVITEVNTTGCGGILLTTTNDQVCWSFKCPVDMDAAKEFAIRYEFATPTGIKFTTAASSKMTVSSFWRPMVGSTTTASLPSVAFSVTAVSSSMASVIYGHWNNGWESVNDSAVVAKALVPGDDRIYIRSDFTLGAACTSMLVTGVQLGYYKKFQE